MNRDTGLHPSTLSKIRLQHCCFPINFFKLLRTPFLLTTSRRLLLWKYQEICNFLMFLVKREGKHWFEMDDNSHKRCHWSKMCFYMLLFPRTLRLCRLRLSQCRRHNFHFFGLWNKKFNIIFECRKISVFNANFNKWMKLKNTF